MQTPKRFPTSFYVKLGAACFMVRCLPTLMLQISCAHVTVCPIPQIGACMELFMINTGFYGV
jgi:hypothetical protein